MPEGGKEEEMRTDKLKEECGVFGMYDRDGNDVVPSIYYGLTALQHRGQEACGMAVSDTSGPKGNMKYHKGMGLVSEVMKEDVLKGMEGNLGIGHVRYSTTGASTPENAQPLVLSYVKGSLALAHNGNLVNTEELRRKLEEAGAVFHTTTDSEVIAYHIARERVRTDTVEEAVKNTAKKIRGAYGLVIMSPRKLVGPRKAVRWPPWEPSLCGIYGLVRLSRLQKRKSVLIWDWHRKHMPIVFLNIFILPVWTAPWTASIFMTRGSEEAGLWQKRIRPRRMWSAAYPIPALPQPEDMRWNPVFHLNWPFTKTVILAGLLSNRPRRKGNPACI